MATMAQPAWMASALARYDRIAIVGAPKTGKTSLASTVSDRPVISTDTFMRLDWSAVPAAVIVAARMAGRKFVVEGVQAARALRSGLEVDAVVVLDKVMSDVTPGQVAMGKGVHTVFNEWRQGHATVPMVKRDM